MSNTQTHSSKFEDDSDVTSREWSYLRLLILLGATLVFIPLLNNSFLSDDYSHIAGRLILSGTSERLFSFYREHFLPLLFTIHLAQHSIFKATPAGFYLVSIAIHLVVVFSIMTWMQKELRDYRAACFAGALFAVSAAHWRAVMWITTQSQLLTGMSFIWILLLLRIYRHNSSILALVGAMFVHLIMLLTFSAGVMIPVVAFLYGYILGNEGNRIARMKYGLILAAPFGFSLCTYFVLRQYLSVGSDDLAWNYIGSLSQVQVRIAKALVSVALGLIFQFGAAATGLAVLGIEDRTTRVITISLILLILAVFIDWRNLRKVRDGRFLVFCLISGVLFYLPPAFVRQGGWPQYFIDRTRYCYLPGVVLIPSIVVLLRNVSWEGINRSWSRKVISSYILFIIVLANVYFVLQREDEQEESGRVFDQVVFGYITGLDNLVDNSNRLVVYNGTLGEGLTHYAGWNVTPRDLCYFYRSRDYCQRVDFVWKHRDSVDQSADIYVVNKVDGRLERLDTSATRNHQ